MNYLKKAIHRIRDGEVRSVLSMLLGEIDRTGPTGRLRYETTYTAEGSDNLHPPIVITTQVLQQEIRRSDDSIVWENIPIVHKTPTPKEALEQHE